MSSRSDIVLLVTTSCTCSDGIKVYAEYVQIFQHFKSFITMQLNFALNDLCFRGTTLNQKQQGCIWCRCQYIKPWNVYHSKLFALRSCMTALPACICPPQIELSSFDDTSYRTPSCIRKYDHVVRCDRWRRHARGCARAWGQKSTA